MVLVPTIQNKFDYSLQCWNFHTALYKIYSILYKSQIKPIILLMKNTLIVYMKNISSSEECY